jgi:tRNA A-37 threonylcarbamoyl transferase component Bud32
VIATDAELLDRLRRVLLTYWTSASAGEDVDAELSQLLRPVGPLTAYATVPARCGQPEAFVKVFSDLDSFEREQVGLRAGQSIAPVGQYAVGVPGVICTVAAAQGLVMERIRGVALSTALRRIYRLPTDRYATIFNALGAWLARFHALDPPDGDPGEVVEQNMLFIKRNLERARGRIGRAREQKANWLVDRLAAHIAPAPHRLVRCHGDFHPANVILTDDRVHVVDFAYSAAGYAEHDLVLLEHSLSTNYSDVPFGLRLWQPLWAGFMNAYGYQHRTTSARALWDLFELRYQSFYVGSDWDGEERTARRKLFRLYRGIQGLRRFRNWLDDRAQAYAG